MVIIKYTRKRLSTLFYRVWINLEYFVYTHYSLLGSVFVFFFSLFWRYLGNIDPDIFLTYECNAQPDIDSNTNSHGHVCKGNEIDTWGDWLYRNRHIIMIGGAFLAIALSIYFEVPLPLPVFPIPDDHSNLDVSVDHPEPVSATNASSTAPDDTGYRSFVGYDVGLLDPNEFSVNEMLLREQKQLKYQMDICNNEFNSVINNQNLSKCEREHLLLILDKKGLRTYEQLKEVEKFISKYG